ncbi:MAG: hypothetical protein AB2A00_31080 [Myxococcota bacterium]
MLHALLIPLTLCAQTPGFGGSQPGGLSTNPLQPNTNCQECHESNPPTPTTSVLPYDTYRGTLMNLATVDPFFLAALEIAFADDPAASQLCVRCHSPVGWMNGRSLPSDGSGLVPTDKEGIACDVCHRAVPAPTANPDAGYFDGLLLENAQLYLADDSLKRGRYGVAGVNGHATVAEPLLLDGQLCAHCHEVTNPLRTRKLADGTDTGDPMPIERTYTEWLRSAFAIPGREGCRDCHMPEVSGPASNQGTPTRLVGKHGFVGGNTVASRMVAFLHANDSTMPWLQGLDTSATLVTQAARQQLRDAAELTALDVVGTGAARALRVRVTNKTGHKLPTGYAEGRRMWLRHAVTDADGSAGPRGGTPDTTTFDFVTGEDPLRTWEIRLGEHALGVPDFHFALVDRIFKDNRIPPEGFVPDEDTTPVGATYPDLGGGVLAHYDDVEVPLGDETCFPKQVDITLHYQTASGEYYRFLLANAPVAGARLQQAWNQVGGSPAEEMGTLSVVVGADLSVTPGTLPAGATCVDLRPQDAGPDDAGNTDANAPDANVPDAGPGDAAPPDARDAAPGPDASESPDAGDEEGADAGRRQVFQKCEINAQCPVGEACVDGFCSDTPDARVRWFFGCSGSSNADGPLGLMALVVVVLLRARRTRRR